MKSNYQEKKENRINAYQRLSVKNSVLSETKVNQAVTMLQCIPMGQPILVGHHSERGHRALLNRSDNAMRSGIEAGKKAEYYADKAEAAASNNAISSDDENAIDLLKAKLAKLLEKQEFMKTVNKLIKKNDMQGFLALGEKRTVEEWNNLTNPPQSWMGKGFPSYSLTNNNGVIKNTRDRIERLEKLATFTNTEKEINGVRVVANASENRIQIFFPNKPTEECRKELKHAGFKWSPMAGAWMRFYGSYAYNTAKEIVTKYYN